jgi:ABC-type polysaccharide/polyol phosphate export permease
MRRVISRVHQGLAWLVLAGVLLQFYLAGMALFGVGSFELHRTLGYLLAVPVVLLLALALAGRLGRFLIGLSALLVLLTIVQIMLPSLRGSTSWIAALHPVNALALLGISAAIGRQRWAERERGAGLAVNKEAQS